MGVQRGLVGEITKRFEQRGYKLQALKLFQADEALLKAHYADLVEKPFFPSLLAYMMSGPVTCMVWEGTNAVKVGRMMLGETNPQASQHLPRLGLSGERGEGDQALVQGRRGHRLDEPQQGLGARGALEASGLHSFTPPLDVLFDL